jgi:ribonuclease-3
LVAAEALIRKEPNEDEGLLSQKRALYVSKDYLSDAGRRHSFSDIIKVGKDVKKDHDQQLPVSIIADVVESVIGATYLDGGLKAAKSVIDAILGDLPTETREAGLDAKTALQEKLQSSCTLTPAYKVLECVGPPHAPTFVVEAKVAKKTLAIGRGPSKKKAEQKAAARALEMLGCRSDADLKQEFAS